MRAVGTSQPAGPCLAATPGSSPLFTSEHDLATRFFGKTFEHLTAAERRVVQQFVRRRHVARDIARDTEEQSTFGERIADRVAAFGGSWTFIFMFAGVLVGWVLLNSYILLHIGDPFDPYPYILLNLFLSMLAAIQAPIIMMSQNRQAAKDRADQVHDYEVNLKTEMELMQLHEKIDVFVHQNLVSIIESQQQQICLLQNLLERVAEKKNIGSGNVAS